MVIADRAAVLVNQVYDIYYMFSGVALACAAVLFAVQIYCDFASYSVIAVGAAKVLGIELMTNFEAPFFSRSIGEFWRRWHVSLSSWFRDYLYIPLGGSRCARPRKYLNNMITFMVSGLWHGASWHYVVWGAIQGAYIVIGEIVRPVKAKCTGLFHVRTKSFGYQFCQGVCCLWCSSGRIQWRMRYTICNVCLRHLMSGRSLMGRSIIWDWTGRRWLSSWRAF